MAEGESEKMSRGGTVGIAANEDIVAFWSKLPKDVQHQVLCCLQIQDLCRMRCGCREWRDVIHQRDFRILYDTANSSQNPSPAIAYLESSYPVRLQWSTYDFTGKLWKNMNCFLSLRQSTLTTLNARGRRSSPLKVSLYSVGSLLLLHWWNFPRGHPSVETPPRGVSSWTVWHRFKSKWKKRPPCTYKVGGFVPFFVHAFVSDKERKTYKILMTHDPRHDPYHAAGVSSERRLVTEIYDSATGTWTDGIEYGWSSDGNESGRYVCVGLLVEWDLETRSWKDTEIEIPEKIFCRFRYLEAGFTIVASGNSLAVTGYTAASELQYTEERRIIGGYLPPALSLIS